MIDITKLTEADVGRWVVYQKDSCEEQIGRIKWWNHKFIFVVHKCANNWGRFYDYTGQSTHPANLEFTKTKEIEK